MFSKIITFNLHFQEIFFVSENEYVVADKLDYRAFNLHFQEIFFVSEEVRIGHPRSP